MNKETYQFEYESYSSSDDLHEADRLLLEEARVITRKAYAPYSHFHVGAVALLKNGQKVTGTNQENASYPVGICAERVLLSSASMLHTGEPIQTMAISYNNLNGESNKPVSPCGMCRQSLAEYEERVGHPIRLILSGMEGPVLVVGRATQLLPFSFKGDDLRG
jgi:cytidine deaminase